MDFLSVIGVTVGFIAIIGGNWLEGGHIQALFNGPALLIVGGGTVGAAMLQSSFGAVRRAINRLGHVFVPPITELESGIEKIVAWSGTARKEGLLGLEVIAETEPDLFARRGLQLLVDGNEPEQVRNVLEVEMYVGQQREMEAAKIYEAMGGYSPTIGIIGAVMGLIHVMGNLADPSQLGPGIATAFVATIYGVGFANLLLIPVSHKIKGLARDKANYQDMLIEGIISIAEGENPRAIEMKLQGYLERKSEA